MQDEMEEKWITSLRKYVAICTLLSVNWRKHSKV